MASKSTATTSATTTAMERQWRRQQRLLQEERKEEEATMHSDCDGGDGSTFEGEEVRKLEVLMDTRV